MPVKLLTVEQHHDVLKRLFELGKERTGKVPVHAAGEEYTSLMLCFMLHNIAVTQSLLRLASFGYEWFPATVGYSMVRPMFEIDVTAHYITESPTDRARQYIEFDFILKKRRMESCSKHRKSRNTTWREGMELQWQHYWTARESEVLKQFDAVSSRFTRKENPRKGQIYDNWSGKSIRKMAEEVDHIEAYDVFYSELSSFTHANVQLADRFLQRRDGEPIWSQRAGQYDVANVFRYAATFLTCFMELFGQQFKCWTKTEVLACWEVEERGKGEIEK